MPIDQFKTQVLLLHSEQSALDTLSSGFGDRYTVHCATSGSEALNTMIDTPINVIISAQKLPGMSGLEALREARKRSPDTIGILLAGSDEAVVGDEEVFQVVRGEVSGNDLLEMVDKATRQMRLIALAESANDTAANPDEPAEHIVMETSENGSNIITGHTGRLRALESRNNPPPGIGGKTVDILVLTKDEEFLGTVSDSSRGVHNVHHANTLKQADAAVREHKIGVAVIDAAMVGEKVEQLTLHLRKGQPRLVSVVAGRRDDGEMLMDLINRGKVYRFLLKPVSPGRARLAIEASIKYHLEAPDTAFKLKPGASPAPARPAAAAPSSPAARAKPKQAPAPAARRPQQPAAKPQPKPAPQQPPANRPPADPPLGDFNAADSSPIEDGLGNAFDDSESSFTATVTGLVSDLVGKVKRDKPQAPKPAAPVQATATRKPKPAAAARPATTAQSSAGDSGGGLPFARIAAIAAALVVLAGTGYFFLGGDDSVPTPADEAIASDDLGDVSPQVRQLVESARAARAAGRLVEPAGDNALEQFAAAADAAPRNNIIAAEFDAALTAAFSAAETALDEQRLEDAIAIEQRIVLVDPANRQLPALREALLDGRLQAQLATARAAIRDGRFEDASTAIAAARELDAGNPRAINALEAELSAALSDQQIDEVLARGNEALAAGRLVAPANDNARYYFERVLSRDTGNQGALRGLNTVASLLVGRAQDEIDAGNLDRARQLIADARVIDSTNPDLAATSAALRLARDSFSEQQASSPADDLKRRADAERRAEAERLAALEAEAEAERRAEREAQDQRLADEQAEAQRLADEQAEQQRLADEQAEQQRLADAQAEQQRLAAAQAAEAEAEPEPVVEAATAAPERSGGAAAGSAEPAAGEPERVAISDLKRTRYVGPKYPRGAERRGQSGWVDVTFTVTADGSVQDVEVLASEPGDVFVDAAMTAVSKWEFEPVVENGAAVAKQTGVRMMFALEE